MKVIIHIVWLQYIYASEHIILPLQLQNDEVAGQNDFVKQYLEQQQRAYEVQRQAKIKIIEEGRSCQG